MVYSDPACLGMILCDQVIEDVRTRKKSFIGVFNDILAGQIPASHPCFFLVLSLTNCRRPQDIEILITRDTQYGEEPVFMPMRGTVDEKNPLVVIDLIFEIRSLRLDAFGTYTIEVKTQPQNQRIVQRSFRVKPLSASRDRK